MAFYAGAMIHPELSLQLARERHRDLVGRVDHLHLTGHAIREAANRPAPGKGVGLVVSGGLEPSTSRM